MPKPHGWSEAKLKKRDRIADAIKGQKGVRSAYAIATAVVQRGRGRKGY